MRAGGEGSRGALQVGECPVANGRFASSQQGFGFVVTHNPTQPVKTFQQLLQGFLTGN